MHSFKSAALIVLQKSPKPLHYKEILNQIQKEKLVETKGKTPEATLNAQIAVEIKTKGKNARFIRTAPGTYSINPEYKAPVKETPKQKEKPKPRKTPKSKKVKAPVVKAKIKSGFVGKAGEHYVTSELLFRGYNASIMSVDIGMDIIATKNNKLFSLQVKTSNLLAGNSYIFDVRKVALERDYAGNVFYLFVMIHPNGTKSTLVLPSYKIDELVASNAIKDLSTQERVRVTLKIRNKNLYIGTLDNEINHYWNNWDVIK